MEYLMTLLEGVITFISPCILPMLPIYISYFMGQNSDEEKTNKNAIINSIGFVLGFTCIFVFLGIISASLGNIIREYIKYINIVLGLIVIIFGLNFFGVITIPLLNNAKGINIKIKKFNFLTSYIFGLIFGVSWTPCVGTFLGTALSLVILKGNILKGIILMAIYCVGLGAPFIISTLLLDKLKTTFGYIKSHYNVINKICGIFLCIIGILMVTGLLDKYFELVG